MLPQTFKWLDMLSCVRLSWYPMDCSPPGSSVHGIVPARILGWVIMSSSRETSQLRDWTPVSPALQASSLPLNHWRSPVNANIKMGNITIFTFAFCRFWTYWDIFIFKAKKFWIPKKDMAMWWKEQRTQNEDNQDRVWILPVWPGTSYLISLGAYSFNIKVTMLFEWPRKHST